MEGKIESAVKEVKLLVGQPANLQKITTVTREGDPKRQPPETSILDMNKNIQIINTSQKLSSWVAGKNKNVQNLQEVGRTPQKAMAGQSLPTVFHNYEVTNDCNGHVRVLMTAK